MNKYKNIFLIGPMGAGKSTIGNLLAKYYKKDFFDTDTALEEYSGANLQWIFDLEGEIGFRIRESKIINKLTKKENIVLATGGGCILNSDCRYVLKKRGIVIYLPLTVKQQIDRTINSSKHRPLLLLDNCISIKNYELDNIALIRNPLYENIADITINNDDNNLKLVMNNLIKIINAILYKNKILNDKM